METTQASRKGQAGPAPRPRAQPGGARGARHSLTVPLIRASSASAPGGWRRRSEAAPCRPRAGQSTSRCALGRGLLQPCPPASASRCLTGGGLKPSQTVSGPTPFSPRQSCGAQPARTPRVQVAVPGDGSCRRHRHVKDADVTAASTEPTACTPGSPRQGGRRPHRCSTEGGTDPAQPVLPAPAKDGPRSPAGPLIKS